MSLNKISQKGQMDLHIKFMDDDGLVQTKYVTSAFLGRATAMHLFEALKSCFPEEKILLNVVQLSMDGPAVNWKLMDHFKSEVGDAQKDRLLMHKSQSPEEILEIGSCGFHVVHGAFESGFQGSS